MSSPPDRSRAQVIFSIYHPLPEDRTDNVFPQPAALLPHRGGRRRVPKRVVILGVSDGTVSFSRAVMKILYVRRLNKQDSLVSEILATPLTLIIIG